MATLSLSRCILMKSQVHASLPPLNSHKKLDELAIYVSCHKYTENASEYGRVFLLKVFATK